MLWCSNIRPKVVNENPSLDFGQISKRLGEIWQGLSEKDKMVCTVLLLSLFVTIELCLCFVFVGVIFIQIFQCLIHRPGNAKRKK